MYNSIQRFQTEGIADLEKTFDSYAQDPKKIAEMVRAVTKEVTKLGLDMIAEEWESYDEVLRDRKHYRRGWHIVRKDETSLVTSLGTVTYHKTLFKNKTTGEYCYLLDRLMGIDKHARMTEDAVARILEEAVDSSYRKGGENVSIDATEVSKETVMNKIHALRFPKAEPGEKRHVERIYIDADEDHVSLQYLNEKGDIRKPRQNTVMPRIVYVYDGVDTESGCRPMLSNVKYFGGEYAGAEGVKELWAEVLNYISDAYELDDVERIYVNGDGAQWIREGAKTLPKAKFVLDKYHMHKYITAATAHLEDSAGDARSEIYHAIHKKKKWMAENTFDRIIAVTPTGNKRKTVEQAKTYILGNWAGIMLSTEGKDPNIRCSAEGHVSHVYSDRMSSRPLGWSRVGVDKMARLRIYKMNGGDMLALVRYQKQETPAAAGAEEVVYSAGIMTDMENKRRKELGELAGLKTYSIPYPQVRKIAAIKNRIWGL